MKNLKLLICVIAISLFASSVAFANSTETTTSSQLRAEVVQLLGSHPFDDIDENESIEAKVLFIINKKSEVVVVSVESSTRGVESFIKEKLNYKKIKSTGLKNGEIYEIPLTLVE